MIKNNQIAIFASGTGSNTRQIISHFDKSKLADIALIVTNNPKAGVLHIAKENKIPTVIINKEEMNKKDYLTLKLKESSINWIVLAGFLLKIPEYLVDEFPNHIINIHPALLPKFGGKGMYGSHVHKAVIEKKETESGITIHFIDQHYDKGEIILQKKCDVLPEDSIESLSKKIHALEHKWFPIAIEKVIREG